MRDPGHPRSYFQADIHGTVCGLPSSRHGASRCKKSNNPSRCRDYVPVIRLRGEQKAISNFRVSSQVSGSKGIGSGLLKTSAAAWRYSAPVDMSSCSFVEDSALFLRVRRWIYRWAHKILGVGDGFRQHQVQSDLPGKQLNNEQPERLPSKSVVLHLLRATVLLLL